LINSNFIVYKLSLNYRSFKAIAGCPPDSSSSRMARQHTQRATKHSAQNCMAAGQLSRYHHKRPMASKFPENKLYDYHVWGTMLEAYCKLKTKLKTSAKLKETLQVIWGNLPQGPINKAVKDFSNKATGGWCCSLELAVNTSNIHSDNGILASDHHLSALFQRRY